MEERVKMFLQGTKYIEPLFIYSKKGILLNKGGLKGTNLSEMYIGNECEVIELIDKITEDTSKHIRAIAKMVKEDLQDHKNKLLKNGKL